MGSVTKCPVCFTKMNSVGHDLVCPECGYKYCEKKEAYTYDDHNHNAYQSYNQKSSYTGNYSTSSNQQRSANPYPAQTTVRTAAQAAVQARQAMQNQAQQYRSNANTASGHNQPKNRVTPGKIVAIIVTFYFIMIFMSMIIALIFSFG